MLLRVALAFVLSAIGTATARAQTDDELIGNMKAKLAIDSAPIDEGKKNNRNNVGTGSVLSWNTYPGEIYVEPDPSLPAGEKWRGTVIYHFSGRERVADYKLGLQTGTNDRHASGRVTATYEFTRGNKVLITDVKKHGGRGRVGDAVVNKVRSLNGTVLR